MPTALRGSRHSLPASFEALIDSGCGSPLVDLTERLEQPVRCGGGAYGDVYKCRLSDSKYQVAVKSVRCFTDDQEVAARLKKVLHRELDLWRRLGDHPNIVPLLGVARNFGPADAPVSPWMSNGTLHSFIRAEGRPQTLHERIQILEGIGSGLVYLHSRDIVHGDLTSSNILVDERCNPRLIDFGLASAIGPLQSNQSHLVRHSSAVGAIRWMAPEILSGSKLEPSADVYSFGCIMLEVISGQIPWQGECDTRVIWLKVKENKIPFRPVCTGLEGRHWALMAKCWSGPRKRPTAQEVVILVTEFLDPTDDGENMRKSVNFSVLFVIFD